MSCDFGSDTIEQRTMPLAAVLGHFPSSNLDAFVSVVWFLAPRLSTACPLLAAKLVGQVLPRLLPQ